MARSQGSVRIGPISLFTLIVVLSMAVLAVLSVTTANASYSLSQRQADFATDLYANETAAQMWLASVDEELVKVRKSERPDSPMKQLDKCVDDLAVAAAESVSANAGSTHDGTNAQDNASADGTGSVAGTNAAPASPTNAAPAAATSTSAAALDARPGIISGSAWVDGHQVTASFSSAAGHELDVTLKVHDDGTYEITDWKSTSNWDDTADSIALWTGDQQNK